MFSVWCGFVYTLFRFTVWCVHEQSRRFSNTQVHTRNINFPNLVHILEAITPVISLLHIWLFISLLTVSLVLLQSRGGLLLTEMYDRHVNFQFQIVQLHTYQIKWIQEFSCIIDNFFMIHYSSMDFYVVTLPGICFCLLKLMLLTLLLLAAYIALVLSSDDFFNYVRYLEKLSESIRLWILWFHCVCWHCDILSKFIDCHLLIPIFERGRVSRKSPENKMIAPPESCFLPLKSISVQLTSSDAWN